MKKALFKWKKISRKQLQILTWWREGSPMHDRDIIICDGSIRSGKTIPMSLSFIQWAMHSFSDELFGITGKTIGSLRQNVVVPLKKILKGRGFRVIERRAEKLLIITKKGTTNIFELFGGKDEASQDLIQGRTLAGVFCDEVALQPESFVNQAMARCSVEGSKIWFNCNPEGPYHWFKLKFIDCVDDLNAFRLQFELSDNETLSEKIKARYKRLYTGVFFKRFILGLWAMADGLIFDVFNDKKHVESVTSYDRSIVGIDYGTSNPCTFGLYVWGIGKKKVHLKREYFYDSKIEGRQKTDSQYADDFVKWLGKDKPLGIYVDPSAISFINELKGRGLVITPANNSVIDGIRFVSSMISNGIFTIDKLCTNTIKEFASYIWDIKASLKGEDKPIKDHDHTCDRHRYALYTHFKDVAPIVSPIEIPGVSSWVIN